MHSTIYKMNTPDDNAHKPMETDWVAWSLQFIVGALVGLGVGFYIALKLVRFGFITFDQLLLVVPGVAMCCGAFASYYGDRAWMGNSPFTPPDPTPTEKARNVSVAIGAAGACFAIIPAVFHIITEGLPAHHSTSIGFTIFLSIPAILVAALLVRMLRTGAGFWSSGASGRYDAPLFYWTQVAICVVLLICILSGVF